MSRGKADRNSMAVVLICVLAGGCVPTEFNPARAGSTAPSALSDVQPRGYQTPCTAIYRPVARFRPPAGNLTESALRAAFRARHLWGVTENLAALTEPDLAEPGLRVRFPAGSINPGNPDAPLGGAGFIAGVPGLAGAEAACLRYRVRFPEEFAFGRGGKLPGLYGGDAPTGGDAVDGARGWSVRLMWRSGGRGEVYEYVVNKDRNFGLSVGRGAWRFPRGRWVEVVQEVVLNQPGRADGRVRVWIDGVPALDQDRVEFRTTDRIGVGGLIFSTFFGGSDRSWASPRDQHLDFADFALLAPATTGRSHDPR